MKKRKKNIGGALLEGLGELVLTAVCFAIGALVLSLFGVTLDAPSLDGDLVVLLGTLIFLAVFLAIYALVQWFKKIICQKRK